MNVWGRLWFSQATDKVGDWHFARSVYFESATAPTAMKFSVEKLTKQLLHREPVDLSTCSLCYAGTSSAGGNPSTVRLELVAVGSGKHLYKLTNVSSAPRRWEANRRFTADCERRFARWCGQLQVVRTDAAWPSAPRAALERYVIKLVAAEDEAARVVEDMAPVVVLQGQVLDALRGGLGFFTAGKEGGSHLFFDGNVFRRNDYGTDPDLSSVHADDASMIECLRRFYDWDAQRESYPHPKPEIEVWRYIHAQLKPR